MSIPVKGSSLPQLDTNQPKRAKPPPDKGSNTRGSPHKWLSVKKSHSKDSKPSTSGCHLYLLLIHWCICMKIYLSMALARHASTAPCKPLRSTLMMCRLTYQLRGVFVSPISVPLRSLVVALRVVSDPLYKNTNVSILFISFKKQLSVLRT